MKTPPRRTSPTLTFARLDRAILLPAPKKMPRSSRGKVRVWTFVAASEDRRVEPGDDAPVARHFIVGMTKSAPARMPVGQREVMVLRRV